MLLLKKLACVAPVLLIVGLVQTEAVSATRLEVKYKKTAQDAMGIGWLGTGTVNGPGFSHPVGIEAVWPLNARRQTGNAVHVNKFLFCIWDPTFTNLLVVFEVKGIINAKNGKIAFNGAVTQSQAPGMPVGSKAQLRAQANAAFNMTMGSVMVTAP